jgi:CubicO group peptidase (beta-lactamase class C family)
MMLSGWADQVDDYVERQMKRQHVAGLSLAVLKQGRVIKAEGYGFASLELHVPATRETVYEIGSVTKPLTATAIMVLVEDGKLGLDDTITNYLPGLPTSWAGVTIRHLLTHTSGIKDYTDVPNFEAACKLPVSFEAIIQTVSGFPLQFKPGDKYAYSNTGFFLLGGIIQKASRKSYAEFMNERIFAPLSMTSTCVNDLKSVMTNRASGYSWKHGNFQNPDYVDMSWPFAAGAIASTVMDMTKWDLSMDTDKILSKARLEQMWTPARLNDGSTLAYAGLGWGISKANDHVALTHNGGIPGFSSSFFHWVNDRVTVIVLLTAGTQGAADIATGVSRRYIPDLVDNPIEDTTPEVTTKLRTVLVAARAHKLDRDWFTEEMQKNFFPARAKRMQSDLEGLGAIKSLLLLEKKRNPSSPDRKDSNIGWHLRYRVAFSKDSLLVSWGLDGNLKISAFSAVFE